MSKKIDWNWPSGLNGILLSFVRLYDAEGNFEKLLSAKAIEEREKAGLIDVIRDRKGTIRRAIRKRSDGAAGAMQTAYVGTRYSYRERLHDGHRVHDLVRLDGSRRGLNYAPASLRPIFLQVVSDCIRKQDAA